MEGRMDKTKTQTEPDCNQSFYRYLQKKYSVGSDVVQRPRSGMVYLDKGRWFI
jgi:hypothetical protein